MEENKAGLDSDSGENQPCNELGERVLGRRSNNRSGHEPATSSTCSGNRGPVEEGADSDMRLGLEGSTDGENGGVK